MADYFRDELGGRVQTHCFLCVSPFVPRITPCCRNGPRLLFLLIRQITPSLLQMLFFSECRNFGCHYILHQRCLKHMLIEKVINCPSRQERLSMLNQYLRKTLRFEYF